MSARLHDSIFALGLTVLCASLIPAVSRRAVMPLSSCALMTAVLSCLVVNYATMGYWYACGMELGSLGQWSFLFAVALEARRDRRPAGPGAWLVAFAVCTTTGAVAAALAVSPADGAIGAQFHDAVLALASATALVSLVPAVQARAAMPVATCLLSASVALLFTANVATLGYWSAAVTESGNVVLWACLLRLSAARRRLPA